MDTKFIIIFVTVPSRDIGEKIAGVLVERRLAACANLIPAVHSIFAWQGKIEHEEELLMVIKSRAALFQKLEAAVRELHPYEVPEVIALPILLGSQGYLDWIDRETSPD